MVASVKFPGVGAVAAVVEAAVAAVAAASPVVVAAVAAIHRCQCLGLKAEIVRSRHLVTPPPLRRRPILSGAAGER